MRARVVGHSPRDAAAWLQGRCTACQRGRLPAAVPCCGLLPELRFLFRLRVSDGSATLDLTCGLQDAAVFLGFPPTDPDAASRLRQAAALLVDDAADEALFCFASYQVAGVRRYSITDTRLVLR